MLYSDWSMQHILASDWLPLLTRITHSDTSDSVSASHCSRYSVSSWLNLNIGVLKDVKDDSHGSHLSLVTWMLEARPVTRMDLVA